MSGSLDDTGDDPRLDFENNSEQDPLAASLDKAGLPTEPNVQQPVYRMMPDSRVPVSSKRGSVWKSRKDQARRALQDMMDAWDEAVEYYNHDQSTHREGKSNPDVSGNRLTARRLNEMFSSTENIVFSNVNGQLPSLYSKNPIVTFTSGTAPDDQQTNDADDAFARAVERLINVLFGMRGAPGIGLKTKAKRAVIIALLTNRAWVEIGYTTKDKSSEQALSNLMELSNDLKVAKDAQEIVRIEGKLIALEEKIEFLQPSGPWVRVRLPWQVLVDPDYNDPYLGDAKWVMIEDMLPTSYLNAVFGVEDPDKPDTITSVFEPTHVLSNGSTQDEIDNFTLFDTSKTYSTYGYSDENTYNKAKRTKVWYVWDKTTRRLELYCDNDWKWPVWVWDDPYMLQNFFPLVPLWFHDNPIDMCAKGEVSYYLDQQDQINEINDEKRRALMWARRNIFYDRTSGITQDTVDAILQGPNATATPIDVPDGKKIGELIFAIPPPSTQFAQLFDKKELYASVDRIVATNEIERGGEFKTNTTNKAVDYYSTMGNLRMDLRLDAIEDFVGEIGWKIAQLCLRFMDANTVQQLTGLDVTQFWKPLDSLGDFSKWAMTCVGGSTQKLSSQAKKQEAVQVGQVLSQYVKAAPSAVLKVTLKMFSDAFDDMMITKEDWDAIDAEVERTLVAGQGGAPGMAPPGAATAGANTATAQPTPGGAAQPPGAGGGGLEAAIGMMQQLPPQMLRAIGMALSQGATPVAILQQIMQQRGAAPPNGAMPPPQGPVQ